nr:ATP-binding protein [Rhizobium sp. NFR07]
MASALSTCDWIRQRYSLLLIGPVGVGKSWLASVLNHLGAVWRTVNNSADRARAKAGRHV